jgi:hypothetical protein
MSVTTLRAIIAAVLFIHGVGHFMGVMPALRLVEITGWNSRSWLLNPLLRGGPFHQHHPFRGSLGRLPGHGAGSNWP